MSTFEHTSSLGELADPTQFHGPLDIADQSPNLLINELAVMLRIRILEERMGDLAQEGTVKTPVHLAIGQEAVAVGVSRHLRATDRVFSGHRSHSHFLALGGDLDGLVAEILCRETGVSAGRGGSMHLTDSSVGFSGSVPLVGGTIPLGLGAALAAKMDGNGDVGLSWFGDGACEEGIVHETLNLAMVLNAPMIFVVENNLYSSHLDIAQRQPDDSTARFAKAHRMRHEVVDGNDLVAVAAAAGRLIDAARAGQGPGFLEAVTYRWRGHVGPDENIDVGVRRSADQVAAWKKRDPVARLRTALMQDGKLDEAAYDALHRAEAERVEAAITAGLAADFPSAATVLDHVYSS